MVTQDTSTRRRLSKQNLHSQTQAAASGKSNPFQIKSIPSASRASDYDDFRPSGAGNIVDALDLDVSHSTENFAKILKNMNRKEQQHNKNNKHNKHSKNSKKQALKPQKDAFKRVKKEPDEKQTPAGLEEEKGENASQLSKCQARNEGD